MLRKILNYLVPPAVKIRPTGPRRVFVLPGGERIGLPKWASARTVNALCG
jgi:hypothetical protein